MLLRSHNSQHPLSSCPLLSPWLSWAPCQCVPTFSQLWPSSNLFSFLWSLLLCHKRLLPNFRPWTSSYVIFTWCASLKFPRVERCCCTLKHTASGIFLIIQWCQIKLIRLPADLAGRRPGFSSQQHTVSWAPQRKILRLELSICPWIPWVWLKNKKSNQCLGNINLKEKCVCVWGGDDI